LGWLCQSAARRPQGFWPPFCRTPIPQDRSRPQLPWQERARRSTWKGAKPRHGRSHIGRETIGGLPFPESVACDANGKALYASLFVSALKPAEKDGKGKISKLSLTGKVLEDQFLPAAEGEPLNKPKGSWVKGNRL
jgi:hypothetical protein